MTVSLRPGGSHYVHKPLTSSNSACLFRPCVHVPLWLAAYLALQSISSEPKNTRVEHHAILRDLPHQELNLSLCLHCEQILYPQTHQEASWQPLHAQIKAAVFPPPFHYISIINASSFS